MEDVGRLSIAQEIFLKKEHQLPEEDHRAGVWYGRRDLVLRLRLTSARIAVASHGMTTHGGCRLDTGTATTERRSTVVGDAQHPAANTTGERPPGCWWCNSKVFRAHATPPGLCDKLVNALKVLANQQKNGDSPIQSIVTGLHERSFNNSCFSLSCWNVSLRSRHSRSRTMSILRCSSHVARLATRVSFAPCLVKIWNNLFAVVHLSLAAQCAQCRLLVRQVTQHPSCTRLVDGCPPLVDSIIHFSSPPS